MEDGAGNEMETWVYRWTGVISYPESQDSSFAAAGRSRRRACLPKSPRADGRSSACIVSTVRRASVNGESSAFRGCGRAIVVARRRAAAITAFRHLRDGQVPRTWRA